MNLNLISFELCPYVQRSIIVLIENDIDHQRTYIDLSNKPLWFKKKSPLGKVPILEVGRRILFESNVICEYLNEISGNKLHPNNTFSKARNRAWIEFGSGVLNLISKFYSTKNESSFSESYREIQNCLNTVLHEVKGPYFNGEEFMMIDAVYATIFRYFDVIEKTGKLNIYCSNQKLREWRNSIFQRTSVKEAVPSDFNEKLLKFYMKKEGQLSKLLSL